MTSAGAAAWRPQPQLADDVVELTAFADADAATMVEWNHDPDIARWFDFAPLPPEDEHLEHVHHAIETWHQKYTAGSRIA